MKKVGNLPVINSNVGGNYIDLPSYSPSFFKFFHPQSKEAFLSSARILSLIYRVVLFKCFLARCVFFTGIFAVITRLATADSLDSNQEVTFDDDNNVYVNSDDLTHNDSQNNEEKAVASNDYSFNSDYYNILASDQGGSDGKPTEEVDDSKKIANTGFNHLAKIETGGKFSSERNIGDGKVLIPIYQTKEGDKLVFTDIRGRFDNLGSSEYNIGLGYRMLINDTSFLGQKQWIVGVYGFLDHLISANKNNFNQATFGFESLSDKYDFRANIYLPENKDATISDSVIGTNQNGRLSINYQREKPLRGVDFEAGYRLPVDFAKTKIFAGGYYYQGDHEYHSIIGSKYRAEVTLDHSNVKSLSKNMQFVLGGEYQYDKERGKKLYGVLHAIYQFGIIDNSNHNSDSTDSDNIKSRMNEFLIRDIDVVTNKTAINEAAYSDIYGVRNREVYVIDSSTDLKSTIQNASDNALIILNGSNGDFSITSPTDLKPGQIISGQRDSLVVTSSSLNGKNYNVKLNTNKARVVNSSGIEDSYLIGLNDNTIIENLDIYYDQGEGKQYLATGNARIINIDGKTNVIINKVGFSSNYDSSNLTAIYANNSRDLTIVGDNLNNASDIGGYQNGVVINNASGAVNISNLNVSNNRGVGITVSNSGSVNLNNINSGGNKNGIALDNVDSANLIGQININNNSDSGVIIANVGNLNNFSNFTANYNQRNGMVISNTKLNNFGTFNADHNHGSGIVLNQVNNSNFGNINANNNLASGLHVIFGNGLGFNFVNANNNNVGIEFDFVDNANVQNLTANNNILGGVMINENGSSNITISN